MLVEVLSCRENASNSGLPARICGETVNADASLPNMATEEFLSCLSRSGIEKAAGIHKTLPRQRVKDTRAALISEVAGGTFILPEARFALTDEEAVEMSADSATGPEDEAEIRLAVASRPSAAGCGIGGGAWRQIGAARADAARKCHWARRRQPRSQLTAPDNLPR